MRTIAALLAVGISLTVPAGSAHAAATAPHLALSAAAGSAVDGSRSAVFDGTFDFANALQLGYPISLVVFQGARFARYPLAGAAATGTSPELADGALVAGEVGALLGEGAPAATGVGVVTVTATRVRVTLPATFVPGATTAVVVTVLPEGTLLSNPIGFTLP